MLLGETKVALGKKKGAMGGSKLGKAQWELVAMGGLTRKVSGRNSQLTRTMYTLV